MSRSAKVALLFAFALLLCGAGGVAGQVSGTSQAHAATVSDPAPPDLDGQAAALAKRVLADSTDSAAALQQALTLSGFTIVDANSGIVAVPSGDSQGLIFQDWEVDAMLAEQGKGFGMGLADFGAALPAALPAIGDQPLSAMLLADIQSSVLDPRASVHFWARFIAELGKQSGGGDPLVAQDPASVTLDAVQFNLLLRRLTDGLYSLAQDYKPAGNAGPPSASYLNAARAQAAPCSMSGVESIIGDATAVGAGAGWGAVVDYVKEQLQAAGAGGLLDQYTTLIGYANTLLSYGKLAMAIDAFNAELSMEGPPPLVRTKEAKPQTGEQKQLQAKLTMDIGNSQIVNCLRPMLNALGLDFSVPTDGAIAGADVQWVLTQGGGSGLNVKDALVEFYGGNPSAQPADVHGVSRIGIEGLGQNKKKSDHARQVTKQAAVQINATVKPANIVQDLVDASAVVAGGPAGIAGMPAELLNRTNWFFTQQYSFPVTDWEDVSWLAKGTVTYDESPQNVPHMISESGPIEFAFYTNEDGSITGKGDGQITFNWLMKTDFATCQGTETVPVTLSVSGNATKDSFTLLVLSSNQARPLTIDCGRAGSNQFSIFFNFDTGPQGITVLAKDGEQVHQVVTEPGSTNGSITTTWDFTLTEVPEDDSGG